MWHKCCLAREVTEQQRISSDFPSLTHCWRREIRGKPQIKSLRSLRNFFRVLKNEYDDVVVDKVKSSQTRCFVSSCCITRMGGGGPEGILISASFKWVGFLLSFWKCLLVSISHHEQVLFVLSTKLCFVFFVLFLYHIVKCYCCSRNTLKKAGINHLKKHNHSILQWHSLKTSTRSMNPDQVNSTQLSRVLLLNIWYID